MKILLLTGDFTEGLELYFATHALQMLNIQVDAACPGKKAGDIVATAVHDFEKEQTYSEKRGHNYLLNKDFDAIKEEEYDGLYIPGGRGAEYM